MGIGKITKSVGGAVGGAVDGAKGLANEVAKQGGKLYQETGKVEGLVNKAYDVTAEQTAAAVEEVEKVSQQALAYVERGVEALYRAAVRDYKATAKALSKCVNALPHGTLAKVCEDLMAGRYESAVATADKSLSSPSGELHQFGRQCNPFPGRGSLLIAVGPSASHKVEVGVSAGIALDLAILRPPGQPKVRACVFVSGGLGATTASELDFGVTVGFLKGRPRNAAGDAIDVGLDSFGFGFPFIQLLFDTPKLNSLTYSFSLKEPEESPSKDFSLGVSYTHILQTLKSPQLTVRPLASTELDGSEWRKGNGDVLELVFRERKKKKKRDRYDVVLNGEDKSQHIWKTDGYDKNDNNINAYSAAGDNVAYGRISRDGNEMRLGPRGSSEVHVWNRWQPE